MRLGAAQPAAEKGREGGPADAAQRGGRDAEAEILELAVGGGVGEVGFDGRGLEVEAEVWGGEDVQLEVGLKEVQDGEAGGVLLVRVVEVWGDDGGLFLVERGVGADGLDGGWEL
jgi:hypothetical protein